MNVRRAPRAPTAMAERRVRRGPARLPGRRPLFARGVWLALVAFTLAISSASLPAYLAQLQTPCGGGACEYQQLTPGQVEALKGMGLSLGGYAAATVVLLLAGLVVCWGVSALLVWRRPDDRMALLVALLLVPWGPLGVATALPAGPSPWRASHNYLIVLALGLFVLVFLLFPSGRFAPRWTRWAVVALLVGQVAASLLPTVPLLPYTPSGQLSWLVAVGEMALVAGVQLYRYRRVSSPLERQQTKWVVVGLAMPIALALGLTVLALGFPALAASSAAYVLLYNEGEFLFLLSLPLAFAFAVLRYRLWDIDALINRTLVYGTLTLTLTGVFVGLVIGLQALLGGIGLIGRDNGVAILLSTLAIVALVQPVRRRLQALIDRRFYRRKYDAAQTLQAFGATLRQEVDLDTLRAQVLAVAQETMQPAQASLWLRPSPQREQGGDIAHSRAQSARGSL